MAHDTASRRAKLLAITGLEAVVIVPGANMVYYTGLHFHLSERPTMAIITHDGVHFIIPKLEVIKLQDHPELQATYTEWGDTEWYYAAFKTAVHTLGLSHKTLGVDGMTMRVFEWLALADAGVNLATVRDIGQALLQQRAIKTNDEVDAMRKAIAVSEQALQRVMDWVQVGATEAQIATYLVQQMTLLGSQGNAFEPIVLVGKRSALPHGNSGDVVLEKDDFLLIDYGCIVDSYPSDITRTFCLGTASDEMRRIYQAVEQANAAARAIAKPGVRCGDVDKAARDVIEAAGYGEYFTHRTGHGLGLSGHELPQIASRVETVLEVGMVFTIEPGIYVPHIGGVRIEDDMLVTADGCESLTTYPRELASNP